MSVEKYTDAPCPTCGSPNSVLNPRWLRERRKTQGWTMRDTAKAIGVSEAFLCDVEHGRRHCKPALLKHYEIMPRLATKQPRLVKAKAQASR